MTYPDRDPFAPQQPPETSVEWGLFRVAHPELANLEEVLFVPQVPRLMGGPSSTQFVVSESLDSPPEVREQQTKTVPRSELRSFTDTLNTLDQFAAQQYDVTLLDVQSNLDARASPPTLLFVPDTVHRLAEGYLVRLTRLAQDTGIPVAIRLIDVEDSRVQEFGFKLMHPPTARSVEDYWDSRAGLDTRIFPIRLSQASHSLLEQYRHNTDTIHRATDYILGL